MSQNGSQKCKLTTVNATGSFRMVANGPGGVVRYTWVRHDSNGYSNSPVYTITVAANDSSLHTVVSDSWTPASSGTDQLVFLSPFYSTTAGSFSCV